MNMSGEGAYSAVRHYENFPVDHFFLPTKVRPAMRLIYAYARMADDLADEGNADTDTRLHALDGVEAALRFAVSGGDQKSGFYSDLAGIIRQHALNPDYFYDLLVAFRQDVKQASYPDHAAVMGYCGYSANPIGRLVLQLFSVRSEQAFACSDCICSALQWINFFQDIRQDYDELGRIYLPLSSWQVYGVNEQDFAMPNASPAVTALLQAYYPRIRNLLLQGAPLLDSLPWRLRCMIRLIIKSGLKVLDQLQQQSDVFSRPRLSRYDKVGLLLTLPLPLR